MQSGASRLVPLLIVLVISAASAAQQPATHPQTAHPAAARPDKQFQKVETLAQQGKLAEAKTALLDELQRSPNSGEGFMLLGIIESSQHDYISAEVAFHTALKLVPNAPQAHLALANLFMAEKKMDLAEKEFHAVLRVDPANQDAQYNLGVLLLSRGAPAEAIPHFQRIHPANPQASLNLIRAYLEAKRAPEALRLATDVSTQNKDDVQVHFSLGLLLASDKQYKAAQIELEKADALQPNTFEILYNLGQTLLRGGDNPKAELLLSRALKLKPESPETLLLQAQSIANQARPLDALDLLVRAHKIAPDNTDIIFLMAQVSISQNYFEDAIPLLESAIKLAPQRSDLRATLGQSYFMAGKVDKSIEVFKSLIKDEPSARSYAFLGLSYVNLGRFDDAKQYLQQGLKLDPANVPCKFNLGLIASRQGDSEVAEGLFQDILRANPDYADALLELANIRITDKKLPEAEQLLRRYVKVSKHPDTGYYKLAMVERSLHETAAADRDLSVFQTLSKNAAGGPYPFEHLFDYLDTRSKLPANARQQLDITELADQIKKHPDQPENLYLLAEALLKSGKIAEARSTIADLDKLSAGDYRTQSGVGVLLARFRLFDDAIQHFQTALQANPGSDEVKFDLADVYFRKGRYPDALNAAQQVSEDGRKDNAYLALLGDIYAHLGETTRATEIFNDAISRNPDNDQDYLALALLEFRMNNVVAAKQTLLKGQARIPGSGKIVWGLGVASVLEGNTAQAADQFERAVDLIPEWPGSYSTLGVFYFQTGQIDKARDVLNRFKNSNARGALDINRIAQVLEQTPATTVALNEPMKMADRAQLLQLALSLADRTL